MGKIDILLVARPDHSLNIYHALNKDTNLTFKYIVFKVFPKWVKKNHSVKENGYAWKECYNML